MLEMAAATLACPDQAPQSFWRFSGVMRVGRQSAIIHSAEFSESVSKY